ncbi:helix-turn-helix domain-containing protein [Kitasatospora sp. NPDC088391]|uniref:helix-turn-helix domain-containing protein n=1 Tax=Kitasatospora sp. NPDC088391 TaxID=3364074 RepID=UPI0037F86C01
MPGHPLPPLSAGLAQVLRSGPFDLALRTAIRERGLSLDGIQRRLARQGLRVSVSSLSYWQRGRSRPERAESLTAVRALEALLGLPPDSLIVLLGPRRPRGRWVDHVPGSLDYVSAVGDPAVEGVLADLDPRTNGRVETLHTRVDIHIGAAREERRIDVVQLVRAQAAGADRLILLTRADHAPGPEAGSGTGMAPEAGADGGPVVFGLVGCRLGRRRYDLEHRLTATELLFDLPLAPGESAVLEYSYAYPSTEPATQYERMVNFPGKNLVLRARFDHRMLPVGCRISWRPSHDAVPQPAEDVRISLAGHACAVLPETSPGVYGLCWEWGDEAAGPVS